MPVYAGIDRLCLGIWLEVSSSRPVPAQKLTIQILQLMVSLFRRIHRYRRLRHRCRTARYHRGSRLVNRRYAAVESYQDH
jgi:hypothetical protein